MHGPSHSLPTRNNSIHPHEYDKSEKLPLDFWDPRRLAAHVLATLPKDQREAAVELILKRQITGAFLARYTHEIEELLSDEEGPIIHAIARTVSGLYYIPWREPHAYDRYTLHDIVKDLWDSSIGSSVVAPATAPWVEATMQAEPVAWMMAAEDAEEEVAPTLEETPLPEPAVELGAPVPTGERQADGEDGRTKQYIGEGSADSDSQSLWESIWLALCPDTRSTFLDSQEDGGETETERSRSGNGAAAGSATLLLREAESQLRRWCFRA
ncbi:hypothetical protein BC827DRAFT_1243362 [Russula dissimulans]|nr:hypothetical protein BC827DRAFT_1243362 [Russula dissimulans]